MHNLARDFPQNGYADHVGDATAVHRRALPLAGPCPYHRLYFRLAEEPV
jgi:ribonuclease HII